MKKIYNISEYVHLFDGGDCTPAVIAALNDAKREGGIVSFDKGEYHFYEKHTEKRICAPYGSITVKNIAFPLFDTENITIDGSGSDFIFHGLVSPFAIERSKNITLKNFTLSYERPFHTEGLIVNANDEEKWFDCEIDREAFPIHTENGRLDAYTPYYTFESPYHLLTEYDAVLREPAYNARYYALKREKVEDIANYTDNGYTGSFWIENLDEKTIRVYMPNKKMPRVGNVMTFLNDGRPCVGVFFENCENVTLQNIDFFDSGAMVVVGQLSKDTTLDGVRIRLRREGEKGYDPKRVVSCSADATHFICCMGKLEIKNCVFENMLDDGTNIHGMYSKITEHLGKNVLAARTECNHKQFLRVGDTVSFQKLTSYEEVMRAVIVDITERPDKNDRVLTFDREIIDSVDTNYFIDNITAVLSETHIHNVVTGNNRPRGFLVATKGKVVIEDCTFHNSSSGIHMQPFGMEYLESQPAEDVTIRRCHFVNCGYSDNCAAISITPRVENSKAPVHKNVSIYDCTFDSFGAPSIESNNTQNLQIYGNTYNKTNAYPEIFPRENIILRDCNLE